MKSLFVVERTNSTPLYVQIRHLLMDVILEQRLPVDQPLPSSRSFARQLKVSRNTINNVYFGLVQDGLLVGRERSGYFINQEILEPRPFVPAALKISPNDDEEPDWDKLLRCQPGLRRNIVKPLNWQDMPYPFICGQVDSRYFPLSEWRECSRKAMSIPALRKWAKDSISEDDEELVEQVRKRLLPRRGIWADKDEILITVGSQHGLHLVSSLLVQPQTTVGIENPGYPDARNLFALSTSRIRYLNVDSDGLKPDDELHDCDLVYVTPSHQVPTTVTMSVARRKELLKKARKHHFLLIEDDYDSEINFGSRPAPALKSMDSSGGWVIYLASLSKTLSPGLRIGYMVASRKLIEEARALRRLMLRHPPTNNQCTLALFLAEGGHDALSARLKKTYRQRWMMLTDAVDKYLPFCKRSKICGGMALWIRGPENLNCYDLAQRAAQEGILIEPGAVYFSRDEDGLNYFKLGFSVIRQERVYPGIKRLSGIIRKAAGI